MLTRHDQIYIRSLLDRWKYRRALMKVDPCEPGVVLELVDGAGTAYHRAGRLFASLDQAHAAGQRLLPLIPN